jgi:hypothetical protein
MEAFASNLSIKKRNSSPVEASMKKKKNGAACLDTSERINYLAPAGN